jgi:hypothetical protein
MSGWTLLALQRRFVSLLLDDSQALPEGWSEERFAIYRNAYRARLVDAIRETYPRTERWVGEDAFRRAAIHHVIKHPPRGWTLDKAGEGMPATLSELFAKDPEVSELAWLEWAMHECFVSRDCAPMDIAGFEAATAAFGPDDWAGLRLAFLPGTRVTCVSHRIDRLWRALADNERALDPGAIDYEVAEPLACVVWRQGLTPVCAPLRAAEGLTLALMLAGESYGDACRRLACDIGADAAIREAGAMLGRWIHHGMLSAVRSECPLHGGSREGVPGTRST